MFVVHLKPAERLVEKEGVGVFQCVSVVQLLGHLPGKHTTPEVTINCRLLVDRLLQVKVPELEKVIFVSN